MVQVFRACLARFKLVPVQEDGRRRKKMQIKEEREKEKRQKRRKAGAGNEARVNGTTLTGLRIGRKKQQYVEQCINSQTMHCFQALTRYRKGSGAMRV